MSNEFLAGYHIPTIQQGVQPPASLLPTSTEEQQQQDVDTCSEYQNINRYIPPGLQGTNYIPPLPAKPPLKRKYSAGPGNTEAATDGLLVIFQGRDGSYPDELNKLIHPLHCTLCDVQMNSSKSAKDHYESKQHDRHITNWLNTNYVEKGLTPPTVKRFIKDGQSGPEAFHCEICDLKFGSLAHASQHYSGRKHKLVASKVSQPSGSGYYNAENKWVRTGTKYVPKTNDERFGIGELFKLQTTESTPDSGTTPDTTTPTTASGMIAVNSSDIKATSTGGTTSEVEPKSLYCDLCKVNATSKGQMTMHLQGVKHKKKMKALSLEHFVTQTIPLPNVPATTNTEDTILESLKQSNPSTDLSMYRTPSGSYYCECCNISMCHIAALQQHLTGKRHLKKVSEVKERAKHEAKSKMESKK
ncbi:zinc finger matrin-type protein 3-like [Anastrepha obliqua]|uniref:zinc finger matrin-type protein 3-like n=1 Tax=Anastrepha obliqua TaxID=95512 RepID=UPI00240978B2|nr:zinc finger matrin-type protein 3-like [Anastrepha obliqua]